MGLADHPYAWTAARCSMTFGLRSIKKGSPIEDYAAAVLVCSLLALGVSRGEDAMKEDAMLKPSKALPLAGEVFSVKGRTAFLILPGQVAASSETPWVWYAPTLRGLPGKEETWMFQKFTNAGIAVAGIDVGESCGNPSGRALFSAFYEELVLKRGLSKTPCLLARSRGGLMLYNWAAEHPSSVACVAGINGRAGESPPCRF